MKIFVEYNAEGDIRSVALPATLQTKDEPTINLRLLPSPGHFVAEVEAENLKGVEYGLEDDEQVEALRNIKYGYHIEGHPHKPRLVQKSKD